MVKAAKRENDKTLRWGRDSVLLLELSLSSATQRVDKKTKKIVVENEILNPSTGNIVTQTIYVVFSSEWGRPTPKDEDVLVACFLISKQHNFNYSKYKFTRAGICKFLGWPANGRYLRDIDTAFKRWSGIRIHATNFSYDEKTKGMVDRDFGIIDDNERQDRERYLALQRSGEKKPTSWFRWSDVMMESFGDGKLKKLDMNLYKDMKNDVAKKLYRYLDMYFWRGPIQKFELNVLMEKLGFKIVKDRYEMKRRFMPAIKELERLQVIKCAENRFFSEFGVYMVEFAKGSYYQPKEKDKTKPNALVSVLTNLGIAKKSAVEFCNKHDSERIQDDIDHVNFLEQRGEIKKSKKGLLFTMLNSDEPPSRPDGFLSRAESKKRARDQMTRTKKQEKKEQIAFEEQSTEAQKRKQLVQDKLTKLSFDEKEKLIEKAIQVASGTYRSLYLENKERGNQKFADKYLDMILEQHLLA